MAAVLVMSTATSTNSTNGGATTPVTLTKPTGVADADYLVAFIALNLSGGTWTAPAGWTVLVTSNVVGLASVYYKKIPTASAETATSYAWTASGDARYAAVMFRVTGAHQTTFVDVAGALSVGSGTVLTLTGATAVSVAALAVGFNYNIGGTTTVCTFTPPGVFTEGYEGNSPTSVNSLDIEIAYKQLNVAGNTGSQTFNTSTAPAGGLRGWLTAIKPASAPATATAGPDQSVEPWTTVTLAGGGTTDGTITGYTWRRISGPTVTLSSLSVAAPTFTAPASMSSAAIVFGLIVTDSLGATSAEDTITVTVLQATAAYKSGAVWAPMRVVKSW